MTIFSTFASPLSTKSTRAKKGFISIRRERWAMLSANWRRTTKRSTSVDSCSRSSSERAVGFTRRSSQASATMAWMDWRWSLAMTCARSIKASRSCCTRAV